MKFLKVNYSLNKKYFVSDEAINEITNEAFKSLKNLELISKNVVIDNLKIGYELFVAIKTKNKDNYFNVANNIEREVKFYSFNLMGIEPNNIEIKFER